MKRSRRTLAWILRGTLLGLAIIATGCGGGSDGSPRTARLEGTVQKGPFLAGSSVTLLALDSDLQPIGEVFATQTTDDLGSFSLEISTTASFVEVVANGFYYDEVAGELSDAPLTLRALIAMSGQTPEHPVNVNLLTTLEADRLRYLILNEGQSYDSARTQTESEIRQIFHFEDPDPSAFTNLDFSKGARGDAFLLTVSATIQADNSVAELSELVAHAALDLSEDGTIDNSITAEELRTNGMTIDPAAVKTHLEERFHALGRDDAEVPDISLYLGQGTDVDTTTLLRVPEEYLTIQSAIDAASSGIGAVIEVSPGVYTERIDFLGKSVEVRSTDPANPEVVSQTVIDGDASGTVVTFNSGEDAQAKLTGITVRNGFSISGPAGVNCRGSSPTITKCVIANNDGVGVYSYGSSATLKQCVVENNGGTGIICVDTSPLSTESVTVDGCTIRGNEGIVGGGIQCITSNPWIVRTTVTGNTASLGAGVGCMTRAAPRIEDCTITDNVASQRGGGLYATDSSPILSQTIFSENSAAYGAGVALADGASPSITDCVLENNAAHWAGGGIWSTASSPTVTRCTLRGNTADFGAGFSSEDHSSPTLVDCVIEGNTASQQGGGVSDGPWCTLTVQGCDIRNNTVSNGSGGGILCNSPDTTITGARITGNSATGFGGGIYCQSTSAPTIENCVISDNAAQAGGGVGCFGASAKLRGCTIAGNTGRYSGGGLNVSGASPEVVNCQITGNLSGYTDTRHGEPTGGGFGAGIAVFGDASAPTFVHCSVADNALVDYPAATGGGLYLKAAAATVVNSIFWGNTSLGAPSQVVSDPAGSLTVMHTIVEGGDPATPGRPFPGKGNLVDDPSFTDPVGATSAPSSLGDYHLAGDSPAIDMGTADLAAHPLLPAVDLEGDPRPLGAGYDLGCDEVVN